MRWRKAYSEVDEETSVWRTVYVEDGGPDVPFSAVVRDGEDEGASVANAERAVMEADPEATFTEDEQGGGGV